MKSVIVRTPPILLFSALERFVAACGASPADWLKFPASMVAGGPDASPSCALAGEIRKIFITQSTPMGTALTPAATGTGLREEIRANFHAFRMICGSLLIHCCPVWPRVDSMKPFAIVALRRKQAAEDNNFFLAIPGSNGLPDQVWQ